MSFPERQCHSPREYENLRSAARFTGHEPKGTVMGIKIYGDAGSGSLRRVNAAAKIMGIELERVNVDLFKGESQTDEFKSRLNPHGLTPVLEEGDVILYEAAAINLVWLAGQTRRCSEPRRRIAPGSFSG